MGQRRNTRRGSARTITIAIVAALLIGFIPMWVVAHSRGSARDSANRTLARFRVADEIASAALYARLGHYEKGRQQASAFFSELAAQTSNGDAFSDDEKNRLRPLLGQRDDIITLLARSDPASVERLFQMEAAYRAAAGM
jgi:CHASE3 domain sensor protein